MCMADGTMSNDILESPNILITIEILAKQISGNKVILGNLQKQV